MIRNEAAVKHSTRKVTINFPDAKHSTQMADVKHELKNVIYSRRLAKGLEDLEIPATTENTPTREQVRSRTLTSTQ